MSGTCPQLGSVISNPTAYKLNEDSKMPVISCLPPPKICPFSALLLHPPDFVLLHSDLKLKGTLLFSRFQSPLLHIKVDVSLSFRVKCLVLFEHNMLFFAFLPICQDFGGHKQYKKKNSTQNGLRNIRTHCSSTVPLSILKKTLRGKSASGH